MSQRSWAQRLLGDPLLWIGLVFVFFTAAMPVLGPLFAFSFPTIKPPIYAGDSFFMLFLFHAALVAVSSLAAILIGVTGGVVATRPAGSEFRPMLEALATIGQTFPPVAVLALAVPAFGYGAVPTFMALTIYGILPILKNTLAGLASVPSSVRDSALGMGMTPFEILRAVELPLAAPIILAGIRTSVIINIGTATIGSTVGAITLGTPIIGGLVTDKISYVIQGAIVVGLFANVTDTIFERIDRHLRRFATQD
jgi:osmoprotectant transport system permease protein